jgi:hypothetical protein
LCQLPISPGRVTDFNSRVTAFIAHLPVATIDAVAFLRHPPTRPVTTTALFLTMKYQIR